MALIIDPDNIDTRTTSNTSITDAVWGTPTGNKVTITSAGTLLTAMADNDWFWISGANLAANDGLYHVDDAAATTGTVAAEKITGTLPPVTDTANTVGQMNSANEIYIDTGARKIYLLEQSAGALTADGITLQAMYSFLKEEWKDDATLIPFDFPMVAVTPEQFEFIEDWVPADNDIAGADEIRTTQLIRTGGWSEIDSSSVLQKQYFGVVTLGAFEDVLDNAHYQLGTDNTDTAAGVDFNFADSVNEAVLTYQEITPADPAPGFAITTSNAIARNDGGDWAVDGYVVGGGIWISNAEDAGNNSATLGASFTILTVGAGVDGTLTVTGTPLTNNAADTTMTAAIDNRSAFTVFLRIRDGDANGKLFDSSDLAAIGVTTLTNKVERFPLANASDLKISATDGAITGGGPWDQIVVRYFDQAFNREVDGPTNRDFGIVVDVGTHSGVDGSFSAAGAVLTSAEGGIPVDATYTGGTLRIHEQTDENTVFTISGTPTATTVTITTTFTATETNVSFTIQRATPVSATIEQIYEKVQWSLRQASDIDATDQVVVGKTASSLLTFVGDAITCGSILAPPSNPQGGGTGVVVEGFDSNDTNDMTFIDNTGTAYTFPFVAAGSISFNTNLVNDAGPAEYFMFFTYTDRTNLTDAAIVTPTGDTGDLESPGSGLPALLVNEYITITGFTNAVNNGLYQVTVVNVSTQDYTVRKQNGATLIAEAAATIDVDENPINSADAIIVDNNSAIDITGTIGGSSVNFDFDYDNNVQGGRTAATPAAITIRAQGTDLSAFVETTGTITRATGLSFSVVGGLERNYSNP